MVLLYSTRLSRRIVTRPGSFLFSAQSTASTSPSIQRVRPRHWGKAPMRCETEAGRANSKGAAGTARGRVYLLVSLRRCMMIRKRSHPCVVVQFGLEKPGFFEKPGFWVAKPYHYPSVVLLTGDASRRFQLDGDAPAAGRDVEFESGGLVIGVTGWDRAFW